MGSGTRYVLFREYDEQLYLPDLCTTTPSSSQQHDNRRVTRRLNRMENSLLGGPSTHVWFLSSPSFVVRRPFPGQAILISL